MQSGCCGALLRMQGGVAGPPCPALDGEHAFLRCCIKSPGAVSPWESGLVEVSWRQGNACCPKCGQSVSVVLLLTHMSDELGASLATELDTPLIHLIGFLRSPVQEEVEDALFTLSEMVSYSFDRDGARLCEIMRTHGGLTQLSWILAAERGRSTHAIRTSSSSWSSSAGACPRNPDALLSVLRP